jgi:PAS domain S-box-containing protein
MSVNDLTRKLAATNEELRKEIAEHKEVEDDLRTQKEILQTIFDHIPVLILFLDVDGRLKLVNRAWERTLGWSLEEIQTQNLDILAELYPDPQERQRVLDFIAAATGEWADFKIRVRDGRLLDTSWANIRLADGTAIGIGQDITARKHAEAERARLFAQLQLLSRQLLQVHEAERRALARELHDEIGQQLTGLGLLLTTSIQRLPPDIAQASLVEAQARVRELIAQVQNLALNLRPAMLDDFGLVPSLIWLFDRYTLQTTIAVRFEIHGLEEQRFASEVETAAFRITQEALTNAARYAGVAEAIVRLWTDADTLWLVIADQGRGFDPQTIDPYASSGLAGMQERTALLGGQLTIESAVGTGTRIATALPLHGSTGSRAQELGP